MKSYTYIIPVDYETLKYLDSIGRVAYTLLHSLIDNTLLYLANEGKDFIPRTLFVEDETSKKNLIQICEKITTYVMPDIRGKMIAKPLDQSVLERMKKAFETNHIYQTEGDIFDLKSLKENVNISSQ